MKMELHCKSCGKYMGTIRDGSIRNGMVVQCKPCDDMQEKYSQYKTRTPYDDLMDIFKKGDA